MIELSKINVPKSSLAGNPLTLGADGYQEYVITLRSHDLLEKFYQDMETTNRLSTIPNRPVSVVHRLPTSRNTTYMMTAEEAVQVRLDPRVLAVDLTLKYKGLKLVPTWTETSSNWSKSGLTSLDLNWALLRTSLGQEITGWGSDASPLTTATVALAASGKNVDVVIVDDLLNPRHPEIAINPDGTGGSRLIQYNWGQWNKVVLGSGYPNLTYTYNLSADYSDHGAHVTGIAAGNTCGWARDANVYNINPYGTSGNVINPDNLSVLEYVKQFHINKPVNPATGKPNPTVVNISWGVSPIFAKLSTADGSPGDITSNVSSMRYAGVVYDTTLWSAIDFAFPSGQTGGAINGTGLFVGQILENDGHRYWGLYFPVRDAATEATIQDLIDAGCIVCGASGNEYSYVMNPSIDNNDHYNDYIVYQGTTYYPKQGNISATPACISVGNINSTQSPGKSQSSNTGPRIDIWSPGENIVSAANTSTNNVVDPRNSNYFKTKLTGTSMATPQVTGVVACLLETYPQLTQTDVKLFLDRKFSTYGQISDSGDAEQYTGTFTSLDGAPNRYLYFYPERPLSGQTWPKENIDLRPTTGLIWPRTRLKNH